MFYSLLHPYCVAQGPSNSRGQNAVVNHKPTNHQIRVPQATGMKGAISGKLKEKFSLTMELGV